MKPLFIEGDIYNGKPNPHAWMSPKRAMQYVDNLILAFLVSANLYLLYLCTKYSGILDFVDNIPYAMCL